MITLGILAMFAAIASTVMGAIKSDLAGSLGVAAIPVVMIYGIIRGIRRDEWWFMVGVGLFFPAIMALGLIAAFVAR